MPVDGSGNFTRSYNFVQDKANGIKIVASRMDGEFDNYAAALNQMLLRSGIVALSGNLNLGTNTILGVGNGAVGSPAIRFNADATSGIYMPAAGRVAMSAGGINRVDANSTGVALTGATTINGAATFNGTVDVIGSEIRSQYPNAIIFKNGTGVGSTAILRNDGTVTYLMLSNAASGAPTGVWNSLRPLQVNNTTGVLTSSNGQVFNGGTTFGDPVIFGGTVTLGSTLSVTGAATLSSLNLTTPLGRAHGGTGLATAPTNGQLLIGNGSGYALSTITAGSNVSVTNGAGTITISATGTVTSVAVSGGTTGLTTSGGPITGSGTITFAGTLVVANGGTGSTTAAGARTNLGAAASGANGDITSLSGLTTPLSIAQGGTGANTAAGARTNLGLGSAAVMTGPGGAIIGTTDVQTLTNKTLTGGNTSIDSAPIATVSGSAPLYHPRAAAYVAGRGTNGACTLNAAFNVASVTRSATGVYDVVFTTAAPSGNYVIAMNARISGAPLVANQLSSVARSATGFSLIVENSTNGAILDPTDLDFIVIW